MTDTAERRGQSGARRGGARDERCPRAPSQLVARGEQRTDEASCDQVRREEEHHCDGALESKRVCTTPTKQKKSSETSALISQTHDA